MTDPKENPTGKKPVSDTSAAIAELFGGNILPPVIMDDEGQGEEDRDDDRT